MSFNLLKRKYKMNEIYSVVDGVSFPIEKVDDNMFSKKLMGEGIAIAPISSIVSAPCTGVLTTLFPTGHGFGITREDGVEILVHIGLDTVNLKGLGFKKLKTKDQMVTVGEPIVEVNLDLLNQEKMNSTILVVFLDLKGKTLMLDKYGEVLRKKSVIANVD